MISSINKNDRVDDITNIYRPDVKDPVDHLSNLEDEMMKAQDIELDMADFDDPDDRLDKIDESADVEPEDETKKLEEEAEANKLLEQMKDKV